MKQENTSLERYLQNIGTIYDYNIKKKLFTNFSTSIDGFVLSIREFDRENNNEFMDIFTIKKKLNNF